MPISVGSGFVALTKVLRNASDGFRRMLQDMDVKLKTRTTRMSRINCDSVRRGRLHLALTTPITAVQDLDSYSPRV